MTLESVFAFCKDLSISPSLLSYASIRSIFWAVLSEAPSMLLPATDERALPLDAARQLFDNLDRNKDGTISISELIAAARDTQSPDGRLLHDLLGLPAHGEHQENGSKDQIVRLFTAMHARAGATEQDCQQSHDGVTFDEWVQFMQGREFVAGLEDIRRSRQGGVNLATPAPAARQRGGQEEAEVKGLAQDTATEHGAPALPLRLFAPFLVQVALHLPDLGSDIDELDYDIGDGERSVRGFLRFLEARVLSDPTLVKS